MTVLILVTAFTSVFAGLLGGSRVPHDAARDKVFFAAYAPGSTALSNGVVNSPTATCPWKCARTDVSPGRRLVTMPSGVTEAVVGSLEKNCASQVTSRTRPSG